MLENADFFMEKVVGKELHDMEKQLIDPDTWRDLYFEMPDECKEVVDGPPQCLGIGKNDKYGWYILGAGQGPCLLWSEKGICK